MSAPEFDRQLLLSAALDGALDDAEQTLFDHELRTDPTFAQEWQELQQLRSELKLSLGDLRQAKPSADLAASIVAAAFASDREPATFSGAAAGKQILRPASQSEPSLSSPAGGRRSWTTRIAGALALAASLMLMVSWLTQFDTDSPSPQQLVDSSATLGTKSLDPSTSDPLRASETESVNNVSPALSDSSPKLAMETPDSTNIQTVPSTAALPPMDQVAAVEPAIPSAEMQQPSPADSVKDAAALAQRTPLKVLLVFSVQVTDKGREQLALQNALRSSGIRLGSDSVVSDQVVSQLRESKVVSNSDAPANGAKLFFIEGSAKKIDRLLTEMVNQPEMFGSVSMSLATDPPLLASVTSLPVADPTQVKSSVAESVAMSMVSSDSRPFAVAENYPFLPVDRSMVQLGVAGMNADKSQQNQDDFTSQLLLIVR